MLFPLHGWPGEHTFKTGKPLLVDRLDLARFPSEVTRRMVAEGVASACWLPLVTSNGILGTLSVASLQASAFAQADLDLLAQVARQVGIAVENAFAFRQIADLKDKLAQEKLYLQDEIRTHFNFDEIVGESEPLRRILRQVETVAPTPATVLILGETGTGKELIARALHNLSPRRERTFVKLNCAAIPTGLLESELFGHEKGAFTGAISRKIGRVELAHQGTLFLDEVGDIPLELQPKLLRVLQEKEFERLGSTQTQKVDVRVIAATNRNLAQMVEEGAFRRDLFYRLNVFPIQVPPLRERREDIPLLVQHFLKKYSDAYSKPFQGLTRRAQIAMLQHDWPGNVRELANVISSAAITASTDFIDVSDLPESLQRSGRRATSYTSEAWRPLPLDEIRRIHIQRVLEMCHGNRVRASQMLGIGRTSLYRFLKRANKQAAAASGGA